MTLNKTTLNTASTYLSRWVDLAVAFAHRAITLSFWISAYLLAFSLILYLRVDMDTALLSLKRDFLELYQVSELARAYRLILIVSVVYEAFVVLVARFKRSRTQSLTAG